MSEWLQTLLMMNLAAAAAIAVAFLLRRPVRRLFGARVAYGLWSLAPLAALAVLLPARVIKVAAAPRGEPVDDVIVGFTNVAAPVGAELLKPQFTDQLSALAGGVWLVGVILSLGFLVWRQMRFADAAREGLAGPAVVGVLRPRVVAPADFDRRYTPREQTVVLAHEETHIARHDSRVNALVALACCVNWFNPLVHLLSRYLRIDQELACDAQVVAAHPKARKAYAEAMLKAQLAARPLPMGCYWPAESQHPLAERIRLLGQPSPDAGHRLMGGFLVAVTATAIAYAAWAAKPARFVPVLAEVAQAVAPPSLAIAAARHIPDSVEHERWAAAAERAPPAPATAPGPVPPQPMPSASDSPDAVDTTLTQPMVFLVSRPGPPPPPGAPPGPMMIQPAIEPGKAIEMLALAKTPDGREIRSHQTSFGSQGGYRRGTYDEDGSRYALRTRVTQKGDQVEVFARMLRGGRMVGMGAVTLASGDTGQLVLTNGQVVDVTTVIRPETSIEVERGRQAMARIQARLEVLYARPWEAYERSCAVGGSGC